MAARCQLEIDQKPLAARRQEAVEKQLAQVANPDCKVIGISVNTSGMPEAEALAYLKELEAEYKMPAVDPFRTGVGALVDALVA